MSMEKIATYKVKNSEDISYIPINQIEFSTQMINKLNELNRNEKYKKYWNKDYGNLIIKDRFESFGLSRIESVIKGIEDKVELPPVDLQIHESIVTEGIVRKYIPPHLRNKIPSNNKIEVSERKESKKTSYSVDNGRHRVVASLFLGLTHIPAKISK